MRFITFLLYNYSVLNCLCLGIASGLNAELWDSPFLKSCLKKYILKAGLFVYQQQVICYMSASHKT